MTHKSEVKGADEGSRLRTLLPGQNLHVKNFSISTPTRIGGKSAALPGSGSIINADAEVGAAAG